MTERGESALHQLASRVGILSEYVDQTGHETRKASDDTRRALLAAMGIDASTDAAVRGALIALDDEECRELLPPVHVVPISSAPTLLATGPAPDGCTEWQLEIAIENGERRLLKGRWPGDVITLPPLPLGYHELRLSLAAGEDISGEATQLRIVVPDRCVTPSIILGAHDAFGLTANLYTVRSAGNWGVGDFSDLAALAEWGASFGGDFVGVNPLHALLNRGSDVSPYSPVSRLFRNPIYIDVMRVPELGHAPDVRARVTSPEFAAELAALREPDEVRYEQVMAVKGLVLTALHRVFSDRARTAPDERTSAFSAFVSRADPALTRFATWMAIAEHEGSDWRTWPEPLRDPDSDGVCEFASLHQSRIEYHCWLQFEADRQLAEAASAARSAGMRIGLYQDLAIGSSPAGADTWAFPELFARGVAVGAPPDPYAAAGQNWGFPPIDPRALRRTKYRYFIQLLRGAFRHAGALRIDHVLGFFRLFWIPDGKSGDEGAYVRSRTDDLLGILALESVRHNAIVVGEDLGTVPPEVPPTLERWGILSSRVMFFERGDGGTFNPPSTYPELALATADTHDMAPIAGFWSGRDIEIRAKVGLIDQAGVAADQARRDEERVALLDRLREEKVLAEPESASPAQIRGAVHAMMCRTPACLVGLALDDLAGETEPVNVPGVGPDKFPSWTRKMRDPLEVIAVSPDTQAALRCDGRRGARDA